jgi:hypothetical protein
MFYSTIGFKGSEQKQVNSTLIYSRLWYSIYRFKLMILKDSGDAFTLEMYS